MGDAHGGSGHVVGVHDPLVRNKNAPERGRDPAFPLSHSRTPAVRASQDPLHGRDATIPGDLSVPDPSCRGPRRRPRRHDPPVRQRDAQGAVMGQFDEPSRVMDQLVVPEAHGQEVFEVGGPTVPPHTPRDAPCSSRSAQGNRGSRTWGRALAAPVAGRHSPAASCGPSRGRQARGSPHRHARPPPLRRPSGPSRAAPRWAARRAGPSRRPDRQRRRAPRVSITTVTSGRPEPRAFSPPPAPRSTNPYRASAARNAFSATGSEGAPSGVASANRAGDLGCDPVRAASAPTAGRADPRTCTCP